ncbi:MAG: methyltransferase domain-containing protein [Candidatus Lokiarchaeota archaeon]|nr:methyltransferase domain-containing protein [Candidatus Lokiarchaeota archaeon]
MEITMIKYFKGIDFSIKRSDLVLEIGAGSNPYKRSDILIDKYPVVIKRHRSNMKRMNIDERPFIVADAEKLPFIEKAFDVIICRHVLEHLDNPEHFISEIKRVGKSSYIETPSPFTEIVHGGYQSCTDDEYTRKIRGELHHGEGTEGHKWFVLSADRKLIMLEKSEELYPLYLLIGYFIKHNTNYKKNRFFKKNASWMNTICKNYENDYLEVRIYRNQKNHNEEKIDINELVDFCNQQNEYKKDIKNISKQILRQKFYSSTKNYNIFDLLACPICKEQLYKKNTNKLVCNKCGEYPIFNNIPILLPEAIDYRY